jgi:hypothetical protein
LARRKPVTVEERAQNPISIVLSRPLGFRLL